MRHWVWRSFQSESNCELNIVIGGGWAGTGGFNGCCFLFVFNSLSLERTHESNEVVKQWTWLNIAVLVRVQVYSITCTDLTHELLVALWLQVCTSPLNSRSRIFKEQGSHVHLFYIIRSLPGTLSRSLPGTLRYNTYQLPRDRQVLVASVFRK